MLEPLGIDDITEEDRMDSYEKSERKTRKQRLPTKRATVKDQKSVEEIEKEV